jgi:hypothetical protein
MSSKHLKTKKREVTLITIRDQERGSNVRCVHSNTKMNAQRKERREILMVGVPIGKLKIKREGGKIESSSVKCVHPKLRREKETPNGKFVSIATLKRREEREKISREKCSWLSIFGTQAQVQLDGRNVQEGMMKEPVMKPSNSSSPTQFI